MSVWQYFHKPRPIPLLMTVAAVFLLFGLGIWQLQRLAWKEALLERLEQASETAPLLQLPDHPQALMEKRFYRFALTGEYLPEAEFHLAARYYRSMLGYSVLTPFKLEDGRMVLVNRGWTPAPRKADYAAPPEGKQTLLLQLRTSDERNPFTPANQPEKNIWFGRDVAAMAAHARLPLMPIITLDVIAEAEKGVYPVATGGDIRPRNDHLGYAITWFSIGIAALVISLMYHRRRVEESRHSERGSE